MKAFETELDVFAIEFCEWLRKKEKMAEFLKSGLGSFSSIEVINSNIDKIKVINSNIDEVCEYCIYLLKTSYYSRVASFIKSMKDENQSSIDTIIETIGNEISKLPQKKIYQDILKNPDEYLNRKMYLANIDGNYESYDKEIRIWSYFDSLDWKDPEMTSIYSSNLMEYLNENPFFFNVEFDQMESNIYEKMISCKDGASYIWLNNEDVYKDEHEKWKGQGKLALEMNRVFGKSFFSMKSYIEKRYASGMLEVRYEYFGLYSLAVLFFSGEYAECQDALIRDFNKYSSLTKSTFLFQYLFIQTILNTDNLEKTNILFGYFIKEAFANVSEIEEQELITLYIEICQFVKALKQNLNDFANKWMIKGNEDWKKVFDEIFADGLIDKIIDETEKYCEEDKIVPFELYRKLFLILDALTKPLPSGVKIAELKKALTGNEYKMQYSKSEDGHVLLPAFKEMTQTLCIGSDISEKIKESKINESSQYRMNYINFINENAGEFKVVEEAIRKHIDTLLYDRIKDKLVEIGKIVDELSVTRKQLEEGNFQLEEEKKQLEEDNLQLEEEKTQLEEETSLLENNKAQLEEEKAQLEEEIIQIENTKQEKETGISALEKQEDELNKKIIDIQEQISDLDLFSNNADALIEDSISRFVSEFNLPNNINYNYFKEKVGNEVWKELKACIATSEKVYTLLSRQTNQDICEYSASMISLVKTIELILGKVYDGMDISKNNIDKDTLNRYFSRGKKKKNIELGPLIILMEDDLLGKWKIDRYINFDLLENFSGKNFYITKDSNSKKLSTLQFDSDKNKSKDNKSIKNRKTLINLLNYIRSTYRNPAAHEPHKGEGGKNLCIKCRETLVTTQYVLWMLIYILK